MVVQILLHFNFITRNDVVLYAQHTIISSTLHCYHGTVSMVGRVKQFLGHVVPGVIKPLRILWNEMIAFIFLCLGLIPIPQAVKAYREFEAGRENPMRLMLTVTFSALMLYFGITSFLRARRISRS